ncbi:MAG: Imm7 family immunity protein [Alphaproteobacteria bacterium]|nr:Imm7 family immunity protein [Alphaproteobacteria bacterium]
MLLGFGWAVIRASQSRLVGSGLDELDAIDNELALADRSLRVACRAWLDKCGDPWLIWQLSDQLNSHSGLLQFHTSRNHRTSAFWDLAEFVAQQSKGSFGVLYVHDDEDLGTRTGQDYSLSFRVWRILDGALTEHNDPLFSPFASQHAFGGAGGFGE